MKPEKARRMVRASVNAGTLVRPDRCEKCGNVPKPTSDGRPAIQGHHPDYSRPLDVEWICSKCHRKETPFPAVIGGKALGSSNGAAKLSEDQINEIRKSPDGCRVLARRYQVDKKRIQHIRTGRAWTAAPIGTGNGEDA